MKYSKRSQILAVRSLKYCCFLCLIQGMDGVPKIRDGYNPATWMLEVTSAKEEAALGVDFSQVYKNSELYR